MTMFADAAAMHRSYRSLQCAEHSLPGRVPFDIPWPGYLILKRTKLAKLIVLPTASLTKTQKTSERGGVNLMGLKPDP